MASNIGGYFKARYSDPLNDGALPYCQQLGGEVCRERAVWLMDGGEMSTVVSCDRHSYGANPFFVKVPLLDVLRDPTTALYARMVRHYKQRLEDPDRILAEWRKAHA